MSDELDDDDHTTFLRVGDDGPVMSRAAFQMHSFGMVNAYKDGHPRFVSDDYLNAIEAETTATALELCTLGLWERVDGGYEIHDDEMVAVIGQSHLNMAEREDACREAGGHVPDDEYPDICGRCSRPLR
jgi:hypothetical protein